MMDKNLVIHIGTHKTGTTSIQDSLLNNASYLLKQEIVFLPLNRYRFILESLQQKHPDLSVFDGFKSSKYSTLVISAERLSGPIANYLSGFKELIALKKIAVGFGFKVKVICYLRRQDTYLESSYMQKIKWGNQNRFSQFLQNNQNQQNLYDYVSRLYELFTEVELSITPFTTSKLKNGDVVDDFWGQLGLDFDNNKSLYKPQNRNVSYGFTAIEITRKLNKFTTKSQKQQYRLILENSDHQDRLETLFTQTEYENICEQYQESNRKLCEKMEWSDSVLGFPKKSVYFKSEQYITVQGTELFYQMISLLTSPPKDKAYRRLWLRLKKLSMRWRYYLNPIIFQLEIEYLKQKNKK